MLGPFFKSSEHPSNQATEGRQFTVQHWNCQASVTHSIGNHDNPSLGSRGLCCVQSFRASGVQVEMMGQLKHKTRVNTVSV